MSSSNNNAGLPLIVLQTVCIILFVGGLLLDKGEAHYFTPGLPDFFYWGTAIVSVSSAPWFYHALTLFAGYLKRRA